MLNSQFLNTSQFLQPTVLPLQGSQVLPLTSQMAQISPTILPPAPTLTPQPVIQSAAQPLVQSLAQPIVAPPIMAQPLTQSLDQPLVQPLAQPLTQPLVQPLAQSLAQPLTQPLVAPPIMAQPLVQPMAQPLIQQAIQPPATPQLIPQPVLSSPFPRPLTPSPTYDKYIPPTPKSTSIIPDDGTAKIYQFYQYAPAQQTPLINPLAAQAPMYSAISSPMTSIQNPLLSMAAPQYRTMSLI